MEDQAQAEQAAPQIQARIRSSFERQGLMRDLGARLGHIGPGCVHIVLANRPEVNQQHGYIHAGATSALADSAGGYAAFTLFPEDTAVLTVEYKMNFLAPAIGDHIEAVGTVLKSGRRLPSASWKCSPSRVQGGHSLPRASKRSPACRDGPNSDDLPNYQLSPESVAEPSQRPPRNLWADMPVDVSGDRDARVTEDLRDHLERHASGQHYRCSGVPACVQPIEECSPARLAAAFSVNAANPTGP